MFKVKISVCKDKLELQKMTEDVYAKSPFIYIYCMDIRLFFYILTVYILSLLNT